MCTNTLDFCLYFLFCISIFFSFKIPNVYFCSLFIHMLLKNDIDKQWSIKTKNLGIKWDMSEKF